MKTIAILNSMIVLGAALLMSCTSANPGAGTAMVKKILPGTRVLVVVNQNSPDSIALGKYYASKRMVPNENIVVLNCDATEGINAEDYRPKIEEPVRAALEKSRNSIDYILMTRGVPMKTWKTNHSIDAALAAMETQIPTPSNDPKLLSDASIKASANPYFGKKEHFRHHKGDIYLVCRLDAYTLDEAKALVDRSLAAKPMKGPFLLDSDASKASSNSDSLKEMESILSDTQKILEARGKQVSLGDTKGFTALEQPLAGYVSWGSNDKFFDANAYRKLKFAPGSIAETFVSTGGRTFKPTTEGQSLIADLVRGGVTGVKGYVGEPYTFSLCRTQILFDRYLAGYNLAESFYMASPIMHYKDIVIGDPLCNPYETP